MDQHSHPTSEHTHAHTRYLSQNINKILSNCVVCVLNEPCTLPQHDVRVIEVRTMEGYGVRWKHDGSEFRGFLEPQMTDGHTVGWRH